jgi:hypothetical protein
MQFAASAMRLRSVMLVAAGAFLSLHGGSLNTAQ